MSATITSFFKKNNQAGAPLGAFEGIAARVEMHGKEYVITTNSDYIAALPISYEHEVYLRQDLRYGPDDATLWPQQYSDRYCHLAAIRTREGTPSDWAILWWDPTFQDFVRASGNTLTESLGKLHSARISSLSDVVDDILRDYKDYAKVTPMDKIPPPLNLLVVSMTLALQRLQMLPSTEEVMLVAVRNLQRTILEVDALLAYLKLFKRRMEPLRRKPPLLRFYMAGLPYWYIRPREMFTSSASTHNTTICKATNNTDVIIEAIHNVSRTVEWYKDPYEYVEMSAPVASSSQTGSQGGGSRGDTRGPSQGRRDGGRQSSDHRYSPYQSPAKPVERGSAGRNKFELLDRPEMPPSIPAWESALKRVDTTEGPKYSVHKSDTYYVLPEPALLAAPELPAQRQLRLHHYQLLSDALLYRMGNLEEGGPPPAPLSSQEWREILGGEGGGPGSPTWQGGEEDPRNRRRATPCAECDVMITTMNRAKELIWQIAETNFHFECLSLDRRASGLKRPKECLKCFPGRLLMGIPFEYGKKGFAAIALKDRHPYNLVLASLMQRRRWRGTEQRVKELEYTVAMHYTQCFYDYFGRAPVIPMRLEHEFGT
ncbi:hypothetical protein DFH09DRAFT_1102809 [Mycena vulgaris]|nr:hypothetical protein DFH09DRAFT_1102809 [Mycena vulgaris]